MFLLELKRCIHLFLKVLDTIVFINIYMVCAYVLVCVCLCVCQKGQIFTSPVICFLIEISSKFNTDIFFRSFNFQRFKQTRTEVIGARVVI